MFSDMRVSTRLATAFGSIVALLLIVIALGATRMAVLNDPSSLHHGGKQP